jgi:type VI secretion system protein ImpA
MSSVLQTASTAASPQVIDIESLLAPIPGDKAAGESVQYSSLYDEIREARRSEDVLEQGDWKRETKVADWPQVIDLATSALLTQTKDLQICAWLTEAVVRYHGFPGLRDSLRVFHGLHELYWDGLFPEEDEGDLEARGNAISWMDRQAALAIKEIPLTGSSSGYSFNDFEVANTFNVGPDVDPAAAEERRTRAAAEGKITTDDWAKAKQSTPRAFYENLIADLNQCWEAFGALDRIIDEKFARQTPGMGALKKALDGVRTAVEKIVKEKRVLEPDPTDFASEVTPVDGEITAATGSNGSGITGAPGVAGPLRSRADAVNRLMEVAAFFRQTEPHSPVSYLVERAARWAQMPLDSWLASVIKDPAVLDSLRETLGMDGQPGGE